MKAKHKIFIKDFIIFWIIGFSLFIASLLSLAYIHELTNQRIDSAYGIRATISFLPEGFKYTPDYYWNNKSMQTISWTKANLTDVESLMSNNPKAFQGWEASIQQNENYVNNNNIDIFSFLISTICVLRIIGGLEINK